MFLYMPQLLQLEHFLIYVQFALKSNGWKKVWNSMRTPWRLEPPLIYIYFVFFSVSHRSEYFSVVWTRTMDMFSVFNDFNWRTIRKGRNVPADNELAKSKRKKMCHLKSVKMNSKFSFVLNLIGDKCGKWQTWCRTNGATNDCCWEPKW